MFPSFKRYTRRILSSLGIRIARTPNLILTVGEQPATAVCPPNKVLSLDFDFVVRDFLMCLKNPEDVSFVKVGAYDGVAGDPLYKYTNQYGWEGLLVEPQPSCFQQLQEAYPCREGLSFFNGAVAKESGYKTFYTTKHSTQAASFSRQHLIKHGIKNKDIREIKVPVEKLMDLIKKTNLYDVDIVQVDAEGLDGEIIKTLDFGIVNPSIIRFEHIHLQATDHDECVKLITKEGYKISECGPDTVAYKRPTDENFR